MRDLLIGLLSLGLCAAITYIVVALTGDLRIVVKGQSSVPTKQE
jgi:hypothetical protein